ncbi:MAG: hypothetical protein U9N06_01080 [candidate division WOR-3 bacterium]|nr:hypothetical protein [candidate division WOR-3 bacterium]
MVLFFVSLQIFLTSTLSNSSGVIENKSGKKYSFYQVNLKHIDYLNEIIHIDGIPMMITHIYSEYPNYNWKEASGEGISCIDDVSRAVILYLKHYELYEDSLSLEKAKKGLKFVIYMEQKDGQFYNFIRRDYTINKEGKNSKKSFNFWAVRGLRALCYGYRVLTKINDPFARELREQIEPTLDQIKNFLKHYGEYEFFCEVKVPKWLIGGGDATAEVILALLDYYTVNPDDEIKGFIEKLADGLVQFQVKNSKNPLYGMHFSWKNHWHAWGNTQTEALAKAGRTFKNSSWLESAKTEADNFYLFLLSKNFLQSIELRKGNQTKIKVYPQISYGIRPMVSGFIQLYIATKEDKYAKLAGLVASWLRGNNRAHEVMYDQKTGRGFDGIQSEDEINRNSGAESTIEAIMAIMEIAWNPTSMRYFYYTLETKNEIKNYVVYRGINQKEIKIGFDERLNGWSISENSFNK